MEKQPDILETNRVPKRTQRTDYDIDAIITETKKLLKLTFGVVRRAKHEGIE